MLPEALRLFIPPSHLPGLPGNLFHFKPDYKASMGVHSTTLPLWCLVNLVSTNRK